MYKNKMEAEFSIIWKKETEINGSVNVSGQDNTLQGNVKVNRPPKNKMEAEFRTEIPERKVEILTTIKDTYVTDFKPNLNYGNSSIIKVGTDGNGNLYRGLLEFNIPKKLQTMYITKAELTLYSDDINEFEELEISLPSQSWGEYNVVWYGQPSRKRIIKTVNLEKGKYEHIIDITDLVKNLWVLYPYENQGLILKSKDETIKQIKNFGTRESINPPKLEIEYFDKDLFSTTGSVIGGNVRVQRTETSDINGDISVFRHSGQDEIKGFVYSKNMDMLEGNINVAQFKELNGIIETERLRKDIQGNIFSSKEKLHGIVRSSACKNLYGIIRTMPNSNIDGLMEVKYKSQLYGNIDRIRPLMKKDINGRIQISDSKDVNGELIVKYKSDMLGNIDVIPMERQDLQGKIQISDKNDLLGQIKVIYKQDLNGQIEVMYVNDLQGCIRSTYKDKKDIESLIQIILKSDLQGSIKVNPVGLKGLINVNGTNDIEGIINTKALQELQGKITTNIKNDLDGQLKVQAMDIDDLNGLIVVGENPNIKNGYIYAFIM